MSSPNVFGGTPVLSKDGSYLALLPPYLPTGSVDFYDLASGRFTFQRQTSGSALRVFFPDTAGLAITMSNPGLPTLGAGQPAGMLYRDFPGEKDLVRQACRTMPRDPNEDEWKKYFRDLGPYRHICKDKISGSQP